MGRDVLPLTVDRLGDLTGSCADCVFWELGPALAARRRRHPREDKEGWLTATLLEWGTPGRVVYDVSFPQGAYQLEAFIKGV